MKKLLYIFAALVAMAAIASCHKEDQLQQSTKKLSVVSSDLSFSNAGGTGTIVVEAEEAVTATSEKAWAQVAVNGKTITVTCEPWDQLEARNSKITIKSGTESLSITAIQQGVVFAMDGMSMTDECILSGDSDIYTLTFSANTEVVVETETEWLTVGYDNESQTIQIIPDENTEMATRHGSFTLKVGNVEKTYAVAQFPQFKETTDWTLALAERGEDYTALKATVKVSHGYYYPDYATPGQLAKYASVAAFVEEVLVPGIRAELDEAVAYYGGKYGYTSFMSTKTVTWNFNLIPDGDYVGFMVGFDKDGYPTGWYSATEMFIGEITPYMQWQGTWSVPHGTGTETWTIEAKEEDKTFWISGIGNVEPDWYADGAFKGEVQFDAETNELVIAVWENTAITWTDATRGVCNGLLSGQYTRDGKTYYNSGVGTVIARLKLSEDGLSATITPCSVVSSGQTVFFKNIKWYGRYTASSGSRSGFSWTGYEVAISEGMTITKE